MRCRAASPRHWLAGWPACRLAWRPLLAVLLLSALAACAGQRGPLQAQRSPFTALDANGDGWLQPAELAPDSPLARDFDHWDSDADGRISWPEFLHYQGFHPEPPSHD